MDRIIEDETVKRLVPILKPNGFRVVTSCQGVPRTPAPGEPSFGPLLFNRDTAMPTGLSMEAYMMYLHHEKDKGLNYGMNRIGYWTGSVRGRAVFAVLCLG